MPTQKYLKLNEVENRLQVGRYTLYLLLNHKKLKGFKADGWQIGEKDLADFIERNGPISKAPTGPTLKIWLEGIK